MNRRSFIGRALAAIGALVGIKSGSLVAYSPEEGLLAGKEIPAGSLVKIQYVWGRDHYEIVAHESPDGWVQCNATSLPADQWIGKKPKCLRQGKSNA